MKINLGFVTFFYQNGYVEVDQKKSTPIAHVAHSQLKCTNT